ncbi:hypothetical protein CEQ90_10115 [Lewinellaceae bacterium SD302]|nr:hypothetical protein CEQ90_10115 [Lewinellaceae bacterium SD302]
MTFFLKTSVSLLFLLSFGLSAQTQNLSYHIALIPDSLKENARSVVRHHRTDYRVTNDNHSGMTVSRAVTLLKGGTSENELVLHYDENTKISQLKITLYDANGNLIRDVRKNEINDYMAVGGGQFYTDSRVKYVTVDHSTYPYTIEYEYEVKYKNFAIVYFPRFFPQDFEQSVVQSTFHADLPGDNELFYDLNLLEEPEISTAGGRITYNWNVSSLRARASEPYGPNSSIALPNVRTVLGRFEIIPNVKSTFESWDEFGRMMNQLMAGRDELPAELSGEVRRTINELSTDREKIVALYRFMQDRVRYVGVQLGIGGWQPFSATYVEENRYGDCKALSNYMKSMLSDIGIEAYPTLIYSGREHYAVREDFPTSAFNHMILYVPSEDMYLECTSNYLPPGYLYEQTLDRNVLLITPEGGQLARTPAVEPADHGHLRTQRLRLAENGSAKVEINTRYVGARHERLRYLHRSLSKKEFKEYLHEEEHIPDVTGSKYAVEVSQSEPFVDLTYATELPRYARKMGKRYFVPLNKLFAFDSRPDAEEERDFAVVNKHGRFLVDTVYLELPQGLSLESKGEDKIDIEHAAGEYHAEITQTGNQLRWVRTLKILPVNLPPEEYAGFRDFYLKVGKADRRQLVFKSVTR